MSYKLTDWMNTQRINDARRIFESHTDSFSPDERVAAVEGLACLRDAKPEYLMNLIPQNHPDRKAAVRLLQDAEKIVP